MVKLMEDIMLTPRLNAKFSTFAQLMALVVFLNTVSCAPMEPFSTRTISSVTGGSTLTALRPRVCTLLMTKLLLNVRLPAMPEMDVDPRTLALLMSEEAEGEEGEVKPQSSDG